MCVTRKKRRVQANPVKLYKIVTGVYLMTSGQGRILSRPIMSCNVIKKQVLAKVNRDFTIAFPGENHRK